MGSILSTVSGPATPAGDEQDGEQLDDGEVAGVALANDAHRMLVLNKALVQRGAAAFCRATQTRPLNTARRARCGGRKVRMPTRRPRMRPAATR